MWKKLTFTGILFFLCGSVRADYIEVRRDNVAIKAAPERDAEEVARVALGTKLDLVGDNQTDGYYEVRLPEGGTGWIYRTLVRRSSGRVMPGGTVTATKLASGFKPVTALPTPLQNLAVLHAVDHTCPIEGDAVKPMHRAQNRAKNNFYATGTLVAVSRATFVALQNKAEDRGVAFGSSNSLPNNRDDLRSLVSVNGTMIG